MRLFSALFGSILVSMLAVVTPAHSGVLTLDIVGAGSGSLLGTSFSGPVSFHLVGSDGGGGNFVDLTIAATATTPAGSASFSNLMRIGLNVDPSDEFAYFGYAIDGSHLLKLFFTHANFLILNGSNSFSGVPSNGYALSGFVDVPVTGGGLTLESFSETASLTAVSAVPELSTWAMMLIGFAGMGLIVYRRSRKMRLVAAGA